MAKKAIGVLVTLLVVSIVLLLGPVLMDPFVEQADGAAGGATLTLEDVRIDSGAGEYTIADGNDLGRDETVYLTRGYAIELTGADDSYVESKSSVTLATQDEFSVCTWAEVDSDAGSKNMTAVNANGRVVIQYNGSEGNWSAWYYNESSRDSYVVDTNAPDQPGNLTNVCAIHNGTAFTIYRNNSAGQSDDTTASSNEDSDTDAANWDGTLEETRVFDEALNNSQRAAINNEPVEPLTNATRTARLMYDESQGTNTFIIFADVDATVSNGTWVAGFDAVEVSAGSDYRWEEDGPRIEILAGGELADAPIAYTDYDKQSLGVEFGHDFADVIDLAPALMLVLVAGLVIFVLRNQD